MDEVIQLIRQARGLLDRAERVAFQHNQPRVMATAGAEGGFEDPQSPASWLRFFRFLRAVEAEGPGGIDRDKQRELMLAVGYSDARAGGGFFGKGGSMRRDPATDQRYLTPVGIGFIQEGRLRFGAEIDELSSPLSCG